MILKSNVDNSINFVEANLVGFIESRYVRRTDKYFIAYMSSQTGCNRGCKFCHLTTTNQLQFKNCSIDEFVSQMDTILDHYDEDTPVTGGYMHINFMARGEALANPWIVNNSFDLFSALGARAATRSLTPKFNLSTIMPVTYKGDLHKTFPLITPTIYYSIYSIDQDWRKRWLPAAMDVGDALENLAAYQRVSKKIVKFHCAFIAGENDSDDHIYDMMNEIKKRKIVGQFNIVRYNSFSSEQGEESTRIDRIKDIISVFMPVKIIPRVGYNVKASCGMFVDNTTMFPS